MLLKMKEPLSITVITKLKTSNAGNQAVSTELIRLIKRLYPDARIFVGWREPGLEQYTFNRLQHAGHDPLRTLDGWAELIVKKYEYFRKASPPGWEGTSPASQAYELPQSQSNTAEVVELAPLSVIPLPLRIYGKGLRTLKMPLDRRRGYGRGYERWLTVLKHSNQVIYSPAGDIGDSKRADYLVRDLLGLRIAQRLGAKVIVANHSIEVKHPLILRLLGQLYSSFDNIVVRDPASAQLVMETHVPPEKINLTPDTAYMAQPAPIEEHELKEIAGREQIEPGTVGILAFFREGFDFSGWSKVIHQLRAMGKQVYFISHDLPNDALLAMRFQQLYGVKVITRQYNYAEYIRVLSLLELVISERYHTCVFSAIANTPFIPLRVRQMNKILGVVYFTKYPIPAVDTTNSGWQDTVMEHIRYVYKHYDQISADLQKTIPRLRQLAEHNVRWNGVSGTVAL